ncbi:MAG: hypothetical protein MZW92_54820 [Comamonadaceae bacterium]|nr:hypothetical protein [Comamonadaceae bacterium]
MRTRARRRQGSACTCADRLGPAQWPHLRCACHARAACAMSCAACRRRCLACVPTPPAPGRRRPERRPRADAAAADGRGRCRRRPPSATPFVRQVRDAASDWCCRR